MKPIIYKQQKLSYLKIKPFVRYTTVFKYQKNIEVGTYQFEKKYFNYTLRFLKLFSSI